MIEDGLHLTDDLREPTLMKDVEAFHQKYGLEYTGKPRMLEPELYSFRDGFITEEHEEWRREQDKLIEALTADEGACDHRTVAAGLNKQLDDLKARVLASDRAAEEYRASNSLITTQGQTVNDQQLTDLNNKLIDAHVQTAEARARFEQVENIA